MNTYPKWAAEAVWYQIFPDRFCRSNFNNPITAKNIVGTSPWNLSENDPWQIHSWTSDWYKSQEYESINNKPLKTNILRRRYCGDIKGIISKLDYLKDLGINALYINPMQYSPSLHKYDGTSFLHIDPFLGSDPLGDLKLLQQENFDDFNNACWTTADREALQLICEAHQRGIRVVFDGVFNHIGYNSKPFQDVLQNRQCSKYIDWFITNLKDKNYRGKLKYDKFWGCVDEMPKLNYGCQQVKQYVFATLKRWLKPTIEGTEYQGIDGWRLDHAIGVQPTFWKSAYKFVKKLCKDSLFLAELIEPNTIIKPYLDSVMFDSVMNYGFYFLACQFFAAETNFITAYEFDKQIQHQLSLFPTISNYLMMNLLGTHDTERLASLIVNRKLKKFDDIAAFFQNTHIDDKGYTSRCPNNSEREIQKMMIVFEFATIGAPMIYYGDEQGMWGANDPDCRKPMMWPEMNFEPEHIVTGNCHNYKKTNPIIQNSEIFEFYKKIIRLRRNFPVLTTGKMSTDFADNEKRIYAFSRYSDSERITFLFNRERKSTEITLKNMQNLPMTDYFTGEIFCSDLSGQMNIPLKRLTFRILIQGNVSSD